MSWSDSTSESSCFLEESQDDEEHVSNSKFFSNARPSFSREKKPRVVWSLDKLASFFTNEPHWIKVIWVLLDILVFHTVMKTGHYSKFMMNRVKLVKQAEKCGLVSCEAFDESLQ